jgi:UDP-N-acetyl-D-mannosaminuronic acid transferase (WecB/TagA/CpsF family)
MAIGGGTQERLGAFLCRNLDYHPAIHCTGAAIGFLSGDQARIPMWADRFRLGWLCRCLHDPRRFVPRYWEARKLVRLMFDYHGHLPSSSQNGAGTSDLGTPDLGEPL